MNDGVCVQLSQGFVISSKKIYDIAIYSPT